MKTSMFHTWVQNRWHKYIPTHFIIDSSWTVLQVNPLDIAVWAIWDDKYNTHEQMIDGNANWIHIELVWDFNQHEPTYKQYNALNNTIKKILDEHPWMVIKNHSDFASKNCPWKYFDLDAYNAPFTPIPHLNNDKRPVAKLKSLSEKDRYEEMVKHYGFSPKTFTDVWNKYKIKPEVLFCIAFAEWFGKNVTGSSNNIMNCWNNDRWDRVSFEGYEPSISCAASKLNWKLLWNKQTIWDLSRAGNCWIDCQYIYASSNSKWEINMRNCLGNIYNKNISPKLEFRIK